MKLGCMCLYDQKSLKYVDSQYISLVMKPSIPKEKCRIEVGNSYIAYIAKNVLPMLTVSLTPISNIITMNLLNPWYELRGPMKK